MTDLEKAAEMALEILDMCFYDEDDKLFCLGGWHQDKFTKTREALRQALAQPKQEPVGYGLLHKDGWLIKANPNKYNQFTVPLYAAPPKREWVGLTEDEFSNLLYFDGRLDHVEVPLIADFIRAIQAKLKEKNVG